MKTLLLVSIITFTSHCARLVVPATDAVASDSRDATADIRDAVDDCTSWARPTGTCSRPGVCCVSSTCVDGLCR